MLLIYLLTTLLPLLSFAQSIKNLGSSGGNGPSGGIGDVNNPVLKAQSFVTDAFIPLKQNTTRQLAHGKPPVLEDGTNTTQACPPPRTILIDDLPGKRQEMVGFGYSWTDSSVEVLNRLTPELQDQVLKELFSPEGNNMGMMRHTIGSSDMSGRQYSFDDNGPGFNEGQPDLSLSNFDLGEDGTAMLEMLARMGSYKSDVFRIGSPWSYPGWMKHNGLFIAPNLDAGTSYNVLNNSFDRQYIPQAIEYFTKYLDAYASRGVRVNGLTLMNEPLNYKGGYPCMYLDSADGADILNHGLGTVLKDRDIALLAYDHNTDQPMYPSQMLQRAEGYVDAAAWHCYAYLANYSVMDDFNYAYPETPQFMTECSNYLPQTAALNWQVVNAFVPAVQHGAAGASMWVLATDPDFGPHSPYGGCAGCQGAIIVNSSTSYLKTNDYYVVGQFSRFIRRGAFNYRVLKGNEGNHLKPNQFNLIAAQNPDRSWAIVFVNNLNRTENVRLEFTGSANVWEGVVPNSTVTTWLIPADEVLRKNETGPSTSTPPFALYNATSTAAGPTGAGGGKGNGSCVLPPVTLSTTSSATSSTTPLIPVPHTINVIEQNVL
ncbi:glycoside hydrolase family 30 protein [Zasmidium cellare ATCC 36951]|uniref:Glycoside hydrolase family 30 protein n=1 Tax=Zasmidium cellare ATCC 36951 TaxID=1080233 RepID=A0A6A6C5G0_ZASCE|nr:glycoside hydrolase family 30 protein [Zasmidium cellare ATCC 36951]KAF2162281.1 glycoside hydrolase family 30 protein [Zasmidium cellare ATCC 36951]